MTAYIIQYGLKIERLIYHLACKIFDFVKDNIIKIEENCFYLEIARIHIAAINHGFLSTLGERFLSFLYRVIDSDSNSILLVEKNDEEIVGFLAGGINIRYVYWEILKRFPKLIFLIIPLIAHPRKIIYLSQLIVFSFLKKKPIKTSPELFSVAVLPHARNKGIAKKLYQRFSTYIYKRGETHFFVVVGENLLAANLFYKKMGAVPITNVIVHNKNSSILYKQNLPLLDLGN